MRSAFTSTFCVAALFATASPAALLAAEPEAGRTGLADIVVTAQRFEEPLQKTPVAVSAFTGEDLEQRNITSSLDIGRFIPNVMAAAQPASVATVNYTIRGLTQTEPSLSVDSAVGLYLNGVYIARNNSAVIDFVDLERVEVLRGPQGTLFGRNSTGGAINIVTRRPGGELSLSERFTVGNLGAIRSITTIDTPKIGPLSLTASYMRNQRNGYVKNLTTDFRQSPARDFGDVRQNAVYAAANLDFDTLQIDYQFDWSDIDAVPPVFQITRVLMDNARGFVDSVYGAGFFDSPGGAIIHQIYENAEALSETKGRAKAINLPYGGVENNRSWGHALTASWDVADNITLKSITGYRKMQEIQRNSFGGGADVRIPGGDWVTLYAAGPDGQNINRQNQFSQELQLITTSSVFDFIGGLYYFREKGYMATAPQVSVSMGNWGPPAYSDIRNSTVAAYGQLTFHVNDRLDLIGGLRYTHDTRKLGKTTFDLGTGRFVDDHYKASFNNVSFNATANYRVTDDALIYGRIATGYKSGGFLERVDPSVQRPFKPEKLTSFEIGSKTEWLDRRLRFNWAAFYNVYRDLQVSQFVPTIRGAESIMSNAAKADYKGVELELTAIPLPDLTLNMGYGYLDARYKSYVFFDPTGQFCGTPGTTCDVSHRAHFSVVPKHTLSAGAQLDIDRFDFARLSIRADVSYNSGYRHGTIDSPTDRYVDARSHALVNARVTLSDIMVARDVPLSLSFWARNLTNTSYIAYGIGAFDSMGFAGGVYNEPRTYGLEAQIRF